MNSNDLSPQDHELIDRLRGQLQAVPAEQRQAAIASLAESLAAGDNASRLVALLASASEPALRHLTVALAARLPAPLDANILPFLRYLLNDRSVPEAAKLDLAAAMLKTTGGRSERALDVLAALVSGMRRVEAIDRLRRLERLAGSCPVIEHLCDRLEEKVMVHCPRCDAYLSRPEMIQHLWEEHRLVVAGNSVRDPWRLIEDWLDAYYQQSDPELLARCRELADRADARNGLRRLYRILLAHQVEDAEARQALVAEAGRRQGSLCPHCFALLEPTPVVEVKPLNVSRGRLTSAGYRVEVFDSGPWTNLEIEMPRGVVHRGSEPGQLLTMQGALLFLTGPLVLGALAAASVFPLKEMDALRPVSMLLLLALLLAGLARLLWRAPRSAFERAVDYGWTLLAPRLHGDGFQREDAAFLAGLALVSAGQGSVTARVDQLQKLIDATEAAVAAGTTSACHLSPLHRLAAADSGRAAATDPVPILVDQAARVIDTELPLAYLDGLLAGVDEFLDTGQQARLRILLCDRAFEAGYEIGDLLEAARRAPAFGKAIVAELPEALAQLRLLWSLRRDVPWASCGSAATAFELAEHADAGARHLGTYPDVLLAAWEVSGGYVCARGMIFHDTLITDFPRTLEVKAKPASQGGGFELLLGDQAFWFREDPEMIVVRLEAWLRYYFHEFRPQVADVLRWRPPGLPPGCFQFQVIRCPECERRWVPKTGDVGFMI